MEGVSLAAVGSLAAGTLAAGGILKFLAEGGFLVAVWGFSEAAEVSPVQLAGEDFLGGNFSRGGKLAIVVYARQQEGCTCIVETAIVLTRQTQPNRDYASYERGGIQT